jgi:rare lipoprotein A
MERDHLSDPAAARWPDRRPSASPAAASQPRVRGRRRPFATPASSAIAGLLATAALVSAACSGNHRPATTASVGPAIERGTASWYGPKFNGRPTASGERYDMRSLTAAHPTLPFGTLVQVTNLANSRQVVVRINDRGPFAHRRIIDLSYAAARELQIVGPGTARVELALVNHGDLLAPAPLTPAPPMVLAAANTISMPAASERRTNGANVADVADVAPDADISDTPGATANASPAAPLPMARAASAAPAAMQETAIDEPDEPEVRRAITPAPAPAIARTAGGAGRFTVQVGAFGEPERADALKRDLARRYPETAVRSDGTWSRVQIGLFDERDEAENLRRELASSGFAAIVVTAR